MADQSMGQVGEALQGLFQREDGVKTLLELLVKLQMNEEVRQHLQAGHHERCEDRQGYRNGYKPRKLKTRVGELELEVPQVRDCEPYQPSFFGRYQRHERAILVACAEMYFQGVSTRNVQEVLEKMCGGQISAMTVSRVAQELDEKLKEFRQRRLDQTSWPYIKIDARYEKVRVAGKVITQAVLVTLGIDTDGRRRILDWSVDNSESESTWGEIFKGLKQRGLEGVKLIISDAHGGIRSAMSRHFQGVPWQRCQVHFKRELCAKVSYKRRNELMKDIKAVLAAEENSMVLMMGEEMAVKWEKTYPAVARMLREGLEDCLTVLSFPADHRRGLASTNMVERLMRQLRKRTAVVGVFPNRASCDRLIGALLLEVDEQWQVEDHCCFAMGMLNQEEVAMMRA